MQTVKTKQRKFIMLLLIFSLPLLLVVFLIYNFSSNKEVEVQVSETPKNQFNQSLPAPKLEDKEKNKLELYMQARQDSIDQQKKEEKDDKLSYDPLPPDQVFVDDPPTTKGRRSLVHQEKRVNEQLDKIMQELHQTGKSDPKNAFPPAYSNNLTTSSPDIARLEQLMMAMQSADTTSDPEMNRLDQMLDKIIHIQNPMQTNPANNTKDTTQSLPVATELKSGATNSGFYSLEPEPVNPSVQKTAITAMVHMDQTVQNGSTIKLRLLQDIYIDQQKIPANNFIFGTCAISDERLYVNLDKIAYNNTIFPIKMKVYDTDGLLGINVPGAITRDAAKQGVDNTFQSLDPSLSGQVASAGIQSIKSLISKKVRAVRATIKAGHRVLIQ